ncbi:hypothetical protein [Candidatus Binatus sp.]|jgi:hypothetical protein|uniref:hypothetical protein n=1 Tax=Candidatus Binatus sp. TaxID=2811406 RepID=UPI003CA1CCB3
MRIARFFVKTVSFLVVLVAVLSLSALARAQLWDGNYQGSDYLSDISVGTTATPLDSIMETAPSTGCPCRVYVDYFVPITSPSSLSGGKGIEIWVSDGTNEFARDLTTTPVNSQTSVSRSGISDVTYANSANVTFTLEIQAKITGWTADTTGGVTGAQNYFRTLFLPSD